MRSTRTKLTRHLLLALALAGGLAACADDDGETVSPTTTGQAATTTSQAATTTATQPPVHQVEVRAYFLRDERVGPLARAATSDAPAAGAVEGLLAGLDDTEQQLGFSSAIPAGTRLNGVRIADGVATVDLSPEFTTGGGSASMMGRVAQVVFTLTQFPTVQAVAFEVDGVALTVLGGEGLLLDQPQTRADWEDLAPAILVESPLPFAAVTSPLRVTGTANTFEAVFQVNITDGEGLIVYHQNETATSGTGTRGTFDFTATFEVPRAGFGSLILFEASAQDGSPIHLVEVPIQVQASSS